MRIEHHQNMLQPFRAGQEIPDFAPLAARHGKTSEPALTGKPDHQSPRQTREALLQAVEAADERMKEMDLHIRLRMNDKSERLQVEVYDPDSGEVIRRIPPDEIIRLAESIEEMAGLILDRSL